MHYRECSNARLATRKPCLPTRAASPLIARNALIAGAFFGRSLPKKLLR
jgi:hypothetical protein